MALLKLVVSLTSLLIGDCIPSDRDDFNPDDKSPASFEQEKLLVNTQIGDPDSLTLITTNIVTPENVGSVPPFEKSGFEFRSVRHSDAFRNGEFTMQQYYEMLRGAVTVDESALKNRRVRTIDRGKLQAFMEQSQVMQAIISDLNNRHFPDSTLVFDNAFITNKGKQEVKLDAEGRMMNFQVGSPDTPLHFDIGGASSTDRDEYYRLWIPLDVIDNMHLFLGSNVPESCDYQEAKDEFGFIPESACTEALYKNVQWWQAGEMGPETMIFFHGSQVPHGSADKLIGGLKTKSRMALVTSMKRIRSKSEHNQFDSLLNNDKPDYNDDALLNIHPAFQDLKHESRPLTDKQKEQGAQEQSRLQRQNDQEMQKRRKQGKVAPKKKGRR